MKILVIKRDKIGDMILSTPLFALIKAALPSAQVHLLANTYNGWVVEGNPCIDKVWLYSRVKEGGRIRPLAAVRQAWQTIGLRRQAYDWIIVAGGSESWRANRRARQLAVPTTRIVAYCGPDRRRGISDALDCPQDGHELQRMVRLLAPLGIVVDGDIPEPVLRPPAAWLESAASFLARAGIDAGNYVMLGTGARKRTRQPEATQILRWAKAIRERFGLHTVFTWTPGKQDDPLYPGDDAIAAGVLDDCPAWIHPYRGDLGTVVGLTWLAKASLYPDSGLMHVAAASPGGVVGLFADPEHSSAPEVWGPVGARSRVVVAPRAIAELPDEAVLTAMGEIL